MNTADFLVSDGKKFKLKNYDSDSTGDYKDKEEAVADLQKDVQRLSELQDVLYAQDVYSLLIVFQAMDAAGKDSVIKHVMSGLNPQGVSVVAFKQPSSEENDHDYLWRTYNALPRRGHIGIFNRSHYEEVLVVRVHPEILQNQQLPETIKTDKNIWNQRFEQIRNFERHLYQNGTHVIKFFLHVSKDEQKKRFLKRINTPEKNWKFAMGDVKERGFWDDYQNAYEDAIKETSVKEAPWYVIPADHKWFTRAAVARIIAEKLESLDLAYPQLNKAHSEELAQAKELLEDE